MTSETPVPARPPAPRVGDEQVKGVLRLSVPLVISFWLRAAFTWVDTAYASLLDMGDAPIAAIGLTMPFEFMMIAAWVGTSNGFTSRLAAAMGAGQGERVAQLKRAARRIIVALSAIFLSIAVGILLFAERVGLEPATAAQFRIYGSVILAGSAFTSFWSILPDSIVKAHQDTRSTMWAGIYSSVANVILNTIFLFVFQWGIFGIALSTVIGRVAGLLYAIRRAAVHEERRMARGDDDVPGLFDRPVRAILVLSLPAATGFLLVALEGFLINGMLARTSSPTPTLAAWTLFEQGTRFLAMPVIATSVALLPVTARLWGRGDVERIRRELRSVLLFALGYALLFVLPFTLVAGDAVIRALMDAEDTRRFAKIGLWFLPVTVLLMGPLFQFRSLYDGMQRPRPSLTFSAIRTFALVLPLTWLGMQWAAGSGRPEIVGSFAGYTLGVGLATLSIALWTRGRIRPPVPAHG